MEKNQFFDNPLMRTKITSANVKPKEMILGYFLGPFCAFISNAIFGAYLNRYYSDVLGWTDTAKFGIFSAVLPMVSVIFVILGNLLVGRLIDNTRTSQGKARPYMLLSAPLVTIAIALLFLTPQNGSPSTQMIWIALSYNFYYAVAYPFFYTAHSSMVALSTRNSDHRGMLATFSNASGVAAVGIGASILVPMLLQSFLFVEKDGAIDTAQSYQNWRLVMIVLCVVTFLAILLEYYFTRERVTEENMKLAIKEEKLPMMKQLKACVSNGYWWIIILYFLLFSIKNETLSGMLSASQLSAYNHGRIVNPVSVISGNTRSSTPFALASSITSRQHFFASSLFSNPIFSSVTPTLSIAAASYLFFFIIFLYSIFISAFFQPLSLPFQLSTLIFILWLTFENIPSIMLSSGCHLIVDI